MSAWWHDDPCEDKPGNSGNGHSNGNGNGHHDHGNGNGYGHDHCVPCFASGTLLQLANGSLKAVDNIGEGDILRTFGGDDRRVLWAGGSIETEETYRIIDSRKGSATVVTKNHGIAVRLLDGSGALAPAKFLTESLYGDFMVVPEEGDVAVRHIMLEDHALLIANGGLVSESYYCGGYSTLPDAQAAYTSATGMEEMELVLPRLRRRDVPEVFEIVRAA
ncbi:hypothetical protein MAL1_00148 [Bacteriophage DSS3_MAL1]|nr:hypothetical protein MAL1_00148 [Bacteriophage DSS3_MAL1]